MCLQLWRFAVKVQDARIKRYYTSVGGEGEIPLLVHDVYLRVCNFPLRRASNRNRYSYMPDQPHYAPLYACLTTPRCPLDLSRYPTPQAALSQTALRRPQIPGSTDYFLPALSSPLACSTCLSLAHRLSLTCLATLSASTPDVSLFKANMTSVKQIARSSGTFGPSGPCVAP